MTKAQRVREKRLKFLKVADKIENVVSWILDQIDMDTDDGIFESREFFLYKNDYDPKLMTCNSSENYDLSEIFSTINKEIFFKLLNQLINKEDGYKSEINFDAKYNHYEVISIIVSIID